MRGERGESVAAGTDTGKLRIAMVTTFYPPFNFGGDGIAIRRLSRGLVRRGHEVTVIHDADAWRLLTDRPEPEPEPEPEGLEVVTLESRLGPLSSLLTHQTGRPVVHGDRVATLLEDGGFDAIHFNNVSLVGGPGILSAGSGLKIYEAHEHWLVCPTHVLWRHDREPCTGRECTRCVLNHGRPPQIWRYTGRVERELEHVDVFIAKSAFSRRKHHEFGFPREMEVLPYFLPNRSPAESPPADEEGPAPHPRPYFLFVGRLERIKGLHDVIPVFRDYRNADLLVAGDGEQGAELREQAADVPGVRFLGRIPSAELDDYYRHARALLVPSVGFETFGIVLIEAFRRGTPVIARRIGPFPEIVERADGGMLFETRDELRAAMRRLQDEPELRDRLGRSARQAFSERWSEETVVPQYLDLIRRTAARTGRHELAERLERERVA